MHVRAGFLIAVMAVGCSKPEAQPAPGEASGAAKASIAIDATRSGSATGNVVDAAPTVDAAPSRDAGAAPAAASCLPDTSLPIGWIGSELVACTFDDAQCWTIDPAKAGATPRAPTHLPGVGFSVETAKLKKPGCYEDLCWKVPARESDATVERIWVAYHPDGKRVAILDDPAGTIFDLATKKPIATFDADLGNSLAGLWFAGNFVVDAGLDAGPYGQLVYHDARTGKKRGTFEEFFQADAGITSTGAILVTTEDVTTVTVIDGKSYKGKTTKRKIPRSPAGCSPQDPGLDMEPEDRKGKACVAFANKHYKPYSGAALVDGPAGGAAFIGLRGGELFTLDKKLVETSRVKLPVCATKDE